MKTTQFLLLSCLLMVGCVRSVHPFYSDAQLIYDPALNGIWTTVGESSKNETLAVTGDEGSKQYQVVYTDNESKTGTFTVHLARLGDLLLADVYPEDLKTPDSGVYGAHFLPLHSFMIVSYNAGSLKTRQMDPDWLKKQLEAKPELIKHEKIDDQIILTAPTPQLQELIVKNIATEKAFGEPAEFKWTGPTTRP